MPLCRVGPRCSRGPQARTCDQCSDAAPGAEQRSGCQPGPGTDNRVKKGARARAARRRQARPPQPMGGARRGSGLAPGRGSPGPCSQREAPGREAGLNCRSRSSRRTYRSRYPLHIGNWQRRADRWEAEGQKQRKSHNCHCYRTSCLKDNRSASCSTLPLALSFPWIRVHDHRLALVRCRRCHIRVREREPRTWIDE